MNYNASDVIIDWSNKTLNDFSAECAQTWIYCQEQLSDFKANITAAMGARFKIAVFAVVVIVLFKMYVEYKHPAFSKTEFYKRNAYRIDLALVVIMFCMIGLMFI